eukprot:COSAG05_NODE_6206_length_1000_cov_1.517203_1_plen_166_part_00
MQAVEAEFDLFWFQPQTPLERDSFWVGPASSGEGLCSNASTPTLHNLTRRVISSSIESASYCSDPPIQDLIIGAECKRAKPHPDPYLEGARRLGFEPRNCFAFEDPGSGVRSGVAAGVAAVIGIRSFLSDAELCKHGAMLSLTDWHELNKELLLNCLQCSRGKAC